MKSESLFYDYYKSTCSQLTKQTSYRNKLVIILFSIIVVISLPELLNEIIILYTHTESYDLKFPNRIDTIYVDMLLYIAFLMTYMHYGSVNIQCRRLSEHLADIENELSAKGGYILDRESGQKDDSYNKYMTIYNTLFYWLIPIISSIYFLYRTLSFYYMELPMRVEGKYVLLFITSIIVIVAFINIFIHARHRTITENTNIGKLTQLNVLGNIGYSSERLIRYANRSLLTMEIDEVAHNLLASCSQNKQVIASVSYNNGDGKTFIAFNLALSLCYKSKKVLLWNLNLRHGDSGLWREILGREYRYGCRILLDKNINIEQSIIPFRDYPNLAFLPVGPIPPNPIELLCSENLQFIIESLKKQYDYIVIDTSSMVVPDTKYISSIIDTTIFVCRAGRTPYTVIDKIRKDAFPNPAIILNGIKEKTEKCSNPHYGYSR